FRLAAPRCSISVKLDEPHHQGMILSRFSLNAAPSPTPVLPPSPTLTHLPQNACQLSISDEAPTTTKLDSGDRRGRVTTSLICTPLSWSSILSSSMDVGLGDQNCTSEGNESDYIMLLSLENQPLKTLENPQTLLISQNPQNSENPQTPQTPTPTEIPDGQPYVEMEFDSMEKARDYYEDYGKNQGFWIRTRDMKKNIARSNELTGALFVCHREGKPASLRVVKPMYNEQLETFRQVEEGQEVIEKSKALKKRTCSTIKVGCKAHMRVKLEVLTKQWK
ncbi:hypothetical protein Dimus_029419, partial [Dionaea muscipula]